MAGGALAVVLMASGTAFVASPSAITSADAAAVLLTAAGSSSLQAAEDAVSAAIKQLTTTDEAYPFINSFDTTLLPQFLTNDTHSSLLFDLNAFNILEGHQGVSILPLADTANGTDPNTGVNTLNPDDDYYAAPTGKLTEEVHIVPQPGTENLTIDLTQGNLNTGSFVTTQSFELSQFKPNPDGSYTVYVGPTQHSGNWIDSTGTSAFVLRDTLGNYGLPHDTVTITPVENAAAAPFSPPVLSTSDIAGIVSSTAKQAIISNGAPMNFGLQQLEASVPVNTFTAIAEPPHQAGGVLTNGTQLLAIGHFALQPDQALVVKMPDVTGADYSAFQINDAWGVTTPMATVQGSLNNTQAFHDPDGFTYYVISSKNPGVANWIDDSGLKDGNVWARFQGPHLEATNTPITTQVVNVADVRQYLPADTPTVTPAETAASVNEHLLDWGYRVDQDNDSAAWLTNTLELDQVKAALGDQYTTLYGTQADFPGGAPVPSVLDRLTDPALSPDWSTVTHDFLADPQGSLSAIVHNLPLILGDITWPEVLAALRLDYVAAGIGQQTGLQGLEAVLNETMTDPSSSITAGFVNAMDDLAVSIMNSGSYSALTSSDLTSVSDQLSQLDQSAWQAFTSGFSLLGEGGTTIASGTAGLGSDLLP